MKTLSSRSTSKANLLYMRQFIIAAALICAACSTPESTCEPIDTSCMPQYEPTFDNIHARTLTPSCATNGASCHATETSRGGFSMSDPDDAYGALSAFAEDPDCSLLAARITSDNRSFRMPPDSPLSAGERCAIQLWIDAGAPR